MTMTKWTSLSISIALVASISSALYKGWITGEDLLRSLRNVPQDDWVRLFRAVPQSVGAINPRMTGIIPAFTRTPWGYTYDKFNEEVDLKGKVAIVTGGNSGIGYFAALNMARKGANVVLACRNSNKCNTAADEIKKNITVAGDTSLLASVRDFAAHFQEKYHDRPLDILLLNAGIGYDLNRPNGTVDGIEATFATNYVGHHLLYQLLKRNLLHAANQNGDARVVLTSSAASYKSKNMPLSNEDWFKLPENLVYSNTKLAQVFFAQETTRQLSEDAAQSLDESFLKIYINAAHPGYAKTIIFTPISEESKEKKEGVAKTKPFSRFLRLCYKMGWMWTAEEGALTILYLATSPSVAEKKIRGKFFVPQAIEQSPNKLASNETIQKELWKFTDSLITH